MGGPDLMSGILAFFLKLGQDIIRNKKKNLREVQDVKENIISWQKELKRGTKQWKKKKLS